MPRQMLLSRRSKLDGPRKLRQGDQIVGNLSFIPKIRK
uniref:Uncharacterized protein n=2 Tax=Picea TaxID=3328 RepID=A0A101LZ79_PICGL|nr:hypothetical protein ABT39_MTgene5067 [Picea glauca]QHR89745.1 hypothetical protein Q903MT_gene3767 [Picea sitchensis]